MKEIIIPKHEPTKFHQSPHVREYMLGLYNEQPNLFRALRDGATIYSVLTHTSRSGLEHRIKFFVVDEATTSIMNISHNIRHLTGGLRPKEENAVIVRCDDASPAFSVIYELGRILHGDGYAFKHISL